jgi:hypothetical protein
MRILKTLAVVAVAGFAGTWVSSPSAFALPNCNTYDEFCSQTTYYSGKARCVQAATNPACNSNGANNQWCPLSGGFSNGGC